MKADDTDDWQECLGVGHVAQLVEKQPDGQFLPAVRPIGFLRFDQPKLGVKVVRPRRRKPRSKPTSKP